VTRAERGRIESRPVTQLADLGVSPMQSSRWQKLVALDEDVFEAATERTKFGWLQVAGKNPARRVCLLPPFCQPKSPAALPKAPDRALGGMGGEPPPPQPNRNLEENRAFPRTATTATEELQPLTNSPITTEACKGLRFQPQPFSTNRNRTATFRFFHALRPILWRMSEGFPYSKFSIKRDLNKPSIARLKSASR
jgi:hypothetical protein